MYIPQPHNVKLVNLFMWVISVYGHLIWIKDEPNSKQSNDHSHFYSKAPSFDHFITIELFVPPMCTKTFEYHNGPVIDLHLSEAMKVQNLFVK